MAVGSSHFPTMHPVDGIKLGVTCAGIKTEGRRDLVVMSLSPASEIVGVFTKNAFCAAPVAITKKHLSAGKDVRYLVTNTGNANAGTGQRGMDDALETCTAISALKNVPIESVLPFSTGVIGEYLPTEKICHALPSALDSLDDDNWEEAAWGILTTDTRPKGSSCQFEFEGETITVTGISKGSGMIRPNMATMLAYVATDAAVDKVVLSQIIQEANEDSFNRITVDGDTSTNDSCVLIATGTASASKVESKNHPLYPLLLKTIKEVFLDLAQAIIRDAEGATKFVEIKVDGAIDKDEALKTAYEIAHSPLVKTALTASDANWGRILAVVGRAGIESLDLSKVDIYLDDVCIVSGGARNENYSEEQGAAVVEREEFSIGIKLNRGKVSERVFTSDLSNDYVRINAEYRT